MSRLTKATYVYWLLVMVNFISVMFDVSLYLLITSYISKRILAYTSYNNYKSCLVILDYFFG